MRFFNRKKRKQRRVFGFLCDPKLALGVKFIAAHLKVPIYVVAEHLLQLGVAQMYPAIEDDEAKRELQEHLINEHLLVSALDEGNEYDKAAIATAQQEQKEHQARLDAALEIVRILEINGVSPEMVVAELTRLEMEAETGVPEISER